MVFTYTSVLLSSSSSGSESVSSEWPAPLFIVDPLQRVDLTEAGDSQLVHPLSSRESKLKGVQEKCLLRLPRPFSGVASLDRVLADDGALAAGVGESNAVSILGRDA